ncbi:hypothetical protein BGZ60DRAFT_353018, partial [Tricladium varicosporioides]
MYGTIEPRLIGLLHDPPSESYPSSPSLELPPLQDPNILKASGRPLLLEPDASKRDRKLGPTPNNHPQRSADLIPPIDEDKAHNVEKQKPGKISNRALGGSSPQSLRKILGDDIVTAAAPSPKKRSIAEGKDDFVQLPQPPKKHKAAKQVVPPIIQGLFEPPPQATLFPPIASSSFHDSHGRNTLNTVPLARKEVEEVGETLTLTTRESTTRVYAEKKSEDSVDKAPRNQKKKDVRPRKKWTEEETNNLLLGVQKHGLGHWADILEDSDFKFNDRSGADLKDRFRTCCPPELRGAGMSVTNPKQTDNKSLPARSKSSLMSENILIDDIEDLVQLGIQGPFRKSGRRERRPFTEEDDREILEGYK